MKEMGQDSGSSPSGKRSRDPEDEVYLDNFHSQKRYLSEIMASSLNGLTVGDTFTDNLMESPARSEVMCYSRDEVSFPYSPMSEDSDDSRYCDSPILSATAQLDSHSNQTSPVSPYRNQKPMLGFSSGPIMYPPFACSLSAVTCSQPRHRGSDSEGRFPSSPSDICHSADLRRAALLRSVQMRAHPQSPPAFELPFCSGQEQDAMTRDVKSLVDKRQYSSMGIPESEHSLQKCYGMSNFSTKRDETENEQEVFGRNVRRLGSAALGGNSAND